MKTISLLITLVFLFSLGAGVSAQATELPDPGLTPDSPFYFLETISEEIITFFTFGDLKKAERYATLAAERLVEARAVVEKGKPELAEKTLERYKMQLEKSIARAEKAMVSGKNTEKVIEVLAKVGKATPRHLEVLIEVREKVPEQAKQAIKEVIESAIEKAMIVSLKGHEKAVEALKARNALGIVPEEISIPEKIPVEAREKIQKKVQQELEIERAERAKENDLQSFESFRVFCIGQGVPPEACASFVNDLQNAESFRAFFVGKGMLPPEMCKKIPLHGFESFGQIEDFCMEAGGTVELCSSVKSRCEEAGVTTPNECFLVLLTATVTKTRAPMSEEEMEERRESSSTPMSEEEIEEKRRREEEMEERHKGIKVPERTIEIPKE